MTSHLTDGLKKLNVKLSATNKAFSVKRNIQVMMNQSEL